MFYANKIFGLAMVVFGCNYDCGTVCCNTQFGKLICVFVTVIVIFLFVVVVSCDVSGSCQHIESRPILLRVT